MNWLLILPAMIAAHELGHLISIKLHGIKITKIRPFSITYQSDNVHNTVKNRILWGGIIGGTIPLIVAANWFQFLTLASIYSCLCLKDIKRLKELGGWPKSITIVNE